jgi:hypothetical protein
MINRLFHAAHTIEIDSSQLFGINDYQTFTTGAARPASERIDGLCEILAQFKHSWIMVERRRWQYSLSRILHFDTER